MDFRLTPAQLQADALLSGDHMHTCLVGGARSGKTFTAVRRIVWRARHAPGSRHTILRLRYNAVRASIALDTFPKVMRLCFEGTDWKEYRQDGFFLLPKNEAQIWYGGLDEKERVEKILGQEYATMFFNECSQLPFSSITMAQTRLAQKVKINLPGHPAHGTFLPIRAFYDLNPTSYGHWTNKLFGEKRSPGTNALLADPENYQRMFMNPRDNAVNLPEATIRMLEALPERQRKRFYEGVYTADTDNVLWTFETIEATRNTGKCVPDGNGGFTLPVADRKRVVVAVDASGAKDEEDIDSDEIGIVVAALGSDGHGYVLADYSRRCSPNEWGKIVANAYREFKADHVVAEANFGGEMVRFVIRMADPNIPVRMVSASRGKEVRAEPVSALYEQKRVHHVGRFEKLEDQMCSFTTNGYIGEGSPDHADAAVWALTDLMVQDNKTGMLDWYVAEAAKQAQTVASLQSAASTGDYIVRRPAVGADGVRLKAPAGISNVYGMTGRSYNSDHEGFFVVHPDDANPLIGQGFQHA